MNMIILGSWTRGELFRKMVWQSRVFNEKLWVGNRSKENRLRIVRKFFYVTYRQKITILHPLEAEARGKNSLSLVSKHGDFFFLGGPNEGLFALWSISSHVGVQICRELVRLIKLIDSNKFLIHIISPRPLKKFSWATFRWSVLGKCRFLVI